jgi:hypothetical protein
MIMPAYIHLDERNHVEKPLVSLVECFAYQSLHRTRLTPC